MIIKSNKEAIQAMTLVLDRSLTPEESIMSEDSLVSKLLYELHDKVVDYLRGVLK